METEFAGELPFSERFPLARMIDANANRISEALRVVEDVCRFALDDKFHVRQLKTIRHALAGILDGLERQVGYSRSRDTVGDVGTSVATDSETRRDTLAHLLTANLKRAQQAARTLEECTKTVDRRGSERLEQIRYSLYEIESQLRTAQASATRLSGVAVYALIDGCADADAFTIRVETLMAAGVDAIQLRDRTLDDQTMLDRARQLVALADHGLLTVVNDRPDIAALAGADGVHLGQEDLSAQDARRIVGGRALVGISTHNLAQAEQAVLSGADYLGVGPVFPSSTKHFDAHIGTDLLEQVSCTFALPVFAIGGIGPSNIDEVARSGCARVAVSSALDMPDPKSTIDALKSALSGAAV